MPIGEVKNIGPIPVLDLPARLGLSPQIEQLQRFISRWIDEANEEVREMLRWQLKARS